MQGPAAPRGRAAEWPGLSAPQRVKAPSGHRGFQARDPNPGLGGGRRRQHAGVVWGAPMTSLRAQTKPAAAAPALHLYVNWPAAGMLAGSHMATPAARRGRTGTGTSPAAEHIQPHSCPGPTICPRLLIHPAHLPGPGSANGQAKPPAPYWRGGTSSAPLQQGEAGSGHSRQSPSPPHGATLS